MFGFIRRSGEHLLHTFIPFLAFVNVPRIRIMSPLICDRFVVQEVLSVGLSRHPSRKRTLRMAFTKFIVLSAIVLLL